jgi:hypothetical protein
MHVDPNTYNVKELGFVTSWYFGPRELPINAGLKGKVMYVTLRIISL